MAATRALTSLFLCGALCLAILDAPPAQAFRTTAMEEVGMKRTGPNSFSIDVDGADVRTVCRAFGEFSGKNIVVATQVKANITIALQNVGWREAFRTILRSADLDYEEEGNILRVDQASRLQAEKVEREAARAKAKDLQPLETRIVKLSYATAGELTAALQSALTRRGNIVVESRSNALIVTDLPENLDTVERMAMQLDTATPQIEITAKLVDVETEALRDLGITWNIGGGDPDLTLDKDLPADFENDIPYHPNNDPGLYASGGVDEPIAEKSGRLTFGMIKDWATIEAQIQALEQDRKANLISNPRITTVDNRQAKIVVGQKIPLIVTDVAGNPVSQLETIGIQLKVTPHLTGDGNIILDLHPEVSELATRSTVQGGVIINTSEADTRVMVKDGHTAVIGGLIRSTESSISRGVPVLKDIPLTGALFRSSNSVKQSRELIIFVTPRIVAPGNNG